jgi:hypothetical protein
MNYSKPEVKTLGQATVVIEQTSKLTISSLDPGHPKQQVFPAYDLDE